VVGTLITDNLVDNFGVSLHTTTIIFALALAVTFTWWYPVEKTLSVHSIYTRRREGFSWLAILFTFALGTAAGDLIAEKFGLGYLASALLMAAVICAITALHYGVKLNAVLVFWLAYILSRPLGWATSCPAPGRGRAARAATGRHRNHLPVCRHHRRGRRLPDHHPNRPDSARGTARTRRRACNRRAVGRPRRLSASPAPPDTLRHGSGVCGKVWPDAVGA
jgi:Repeat of Unknown Function (DUF347)